MSLLLSPLNALHMTTDIYVVSCQEIPSLSSCHVHRHNSFNTISLRINHSDLFHHFYPRFLLSVLSLDHVTYSALCVCVSLPQWDSHDRGRWVRKNGPIRDVPLPTSCPTWQAFPSSSSEDVGGIAQILQLIL